MTNEKKQNEEKDPGQNREFEKGERSHPADDVSQKTEVKNAHAAGDGAMGPNETPLPDVDEPNEHEAPEEPPY